MRWLAPHEYKFGITGKTKESILSITKNTSYILWGLTGARGGGKSYLVRAREVYRRLKYPNTKGLIVRKTYPELVANHIEPILQEYPVAAERRAYNPKEHIGYLSGKKIHWKTGSITDFSYLGSLMDVYIYQGREYEDISIDEVTQHEELVFKMLRGSNRTTNPNVKPTMILTGNPGGIGHGWVKRIFVDRLFKDKEKPEDFGFIQAKVYDNKALMDADPDYIQRLKDLPDDLRRAWLEGDWDVFAGQVFSEFRRDLHVMKRKVPSASYPHFLWIDWGYSGRSGDEGAFACCAAVLVKVKYGDQTFNRVVIYNEWYGKGMHPKEWAEKIYKEAPCRTIKGAYGDPAMFNTQTDGSKPISKLMQEKWEELNDGRWVTMKKGNNNRIARVATFHNWLSLAPDGLPYMLITESCPNLIRTLPLLVYDEHRVEDVDTEGEDHLYDAVGYGLSAIKFLPARIGGISTRPKDRRKDVLPEMINALDTTLFEKPMKKVKDWRV